MKPFLVSLIFLLIACDHVNHKAVDNKRVNPQPKSIDTSIYAILKFDKVNNYYFDKNAKPSTLSSEDIVKIEDLISKRVSEYNKIEKDSAISITKQLRKKFHDPNFIWKGDFIESPSKYYKQLVPIINSKGEKEVWVNCFCETGEKSYWKKDIVRVSDGGSCFFQLKINLTKNTVYNFFVNGVA